MAGFRFNVIGHGQILYVDDGDMIRMIMPDIKEHSRVFGDPMKNGSCEQGNLDPIGPGKSTLEIVPKQRNSIKLSDLLRIHPDCEHLFLRNNFLKPHIDDHCIEIWIPKPDKPADVYGKARLRLYSEPVIPDDPDHRH